MEYDLYLLKNVSKISGLIECNFDNSSFFPLVSLLHKCVVRLLQELGRFANIRSSLRNKVGKR